MDSSHLKELATDWTQLLIRFIGTLVLDNVVRVSLSQDIQLNSTASIVSAIKQQMLTRNRKQAPNTSNVWCKNDTTLKIYTLCGKQILNDKSGSTCRTGVGTRLQAGRSWVRDQRT
jgi:hypothetical protein